MPPANIWGYWSSVRCMYMPRIPVILHEYLLKVLYNIHIGQVPLEVHIVWQERYDTIRIDILPLHDTYH